MIQTIKNIWNNILTSQCKPYINKANKYAKQIQSLNEEYEELFTAYKTIEMNYGLLEKDRDLVLKELKLVDKHFTLENYKEWLFENTEPSRIMYDFGNGRKAVHTIFADSIKDEEIIREFIEKDLGFKYDFYKTPDAMVYAFSHAFTRKYPTSRFYSFDTELYGKVEQWDIAKNTINFIRTQQTYGDCDNVMVLKYSCLYHMLKDKFPDQLWRLRGFIVNVLGYGGHAMLGWVKAEDNLNDWVPIETTFNANYQPVMWARNYRLRDQILYTIHYSFDHEHEYRRI